MQTSGVIFAQIFKQVQTAADAALNLLFPPRCVACGRTGTALCADCVESFPPLVEPLCEICSQPLHHPGSCRNCKALRPAYENLKSACLFDGGLRKAVHGLKYRRSRQLAKPLAALMANRIMMPGPTTLLCPVPLHPDRLRERGYNQSRDLAVQLSLLWGCACLPDQALRRIKRTESQVGQSHAARQENMQGAFAADTALVGGRAILLVDDVCTTGATLNACAGALLMDGAASVSAVTLARAAHERQ